MTATFQMTNTHRVEPAEVLPGGFFKFGGHLVPLYLYDEWWKVTQREGHIVRMVNRAGVYRTLILDHWDGILCYRWIPRTELSVS